MMYLILLVVLMLLSSYELVGKKKVELKQMSTREDRYTFALRCIVVGSISLHIARYGHGWIEGSLFFLISVISLNSLIEVSVTFILWLREYIHELTISAFCTLAIPIIILWHIKYIDARVERLLALAVLLMSLGMVYMELIKMMTYTVKKEYLIKERRLKLQRIITWFMIIILNQYALLLVIQFYFGARWHHFIDAEVLDYRAMIDVFYYLIITFTTVGFGDIHPGTEIAKFITCIIAMTGMLFTGLFIGGVLGNDSKG